METHVLSRTFLSIYRYLNALTKSIDRVVQLKGINSSSFNDYYKNNTQDQTQEIINLTNKKITLINIKVIVDKTLKQLDQFQSRLLILKYIDNFSAKDICNLTQLNMRTYFRKVNAGINNFEKILSKFFENNQQLFKQICSEQWIKKLINDSTTLADKTDLEGNLIYKTLIKNFQKSAII